MSGHVMRNPAPMKGRLVIGFAPIPGSKRDPDGRIILDWIYAPKGARMTEDGIVAPAPPPAAPIITRGIRVEAHQSSLL